MSGKQKSVTFNEQVEVKVIDNVSKPVNTTNDLNLDFEYGSNLQQWLRYNNTSFVFTSYKTNRIYSIGLTVDPVDNKEKLSIWFTNYDRPTGITVNGNSAYLVTKNNIWKYSNTNGTETDDDGFDATFSHSLIYNVGNVDAHDITIDKDGKVFFCNTKFSCVCSPSDTHNFKVEYIPPWISKLACEDRCHLNGICTDGDGIVRYITTICNSDVHDGWRNHRKEEDGFIFDIIDNKVVCSNLTMPHSPRFYKDKLWVLNSGKGEFGYVKDGIFIPITFIPGFLRGLDFTGKYAIIGSSMDRHEKRFNGLLLEDILISKNIEARCGIYIVDITNGYIISSMSFNNLVELYDVQFMPDTRRPRFLDINHDIEMNIHRFVDPYN